MFDRSSAIRRLRFLLACGLAVGGLGLAAPARAATLPFTATLSISLGGLPTATFTGSGVGQSNGLGQSFTLPANFVSGLATFGPSFFTGLPTIYKLSIAVSGNGAGSFNPGFSPPSLHPAHVMLQDYYSTRARVGGAMAVSGGAFVNVLQLFTVPVPLSNLGAGSTLMVTTGGLQVFAAATQWTTATGVVLGITATTHLPASMSVVVTNGAAYTYGSDARTAGGAGQVTLVTPIKVVATAAGKLAVITRLTVNFVPEPGAALLLGVGIAGLAALGRRRRPQA